MNRVPERDQRHSRRSLLIVIVCVVIALFEGFDLQSIGIAAPSMAKSLGFSSLQMGYAFGVGALGLLLGAVFGGRLADRIGKKEALLLSMVTFGVFSIATAHAGNFESLLVVRALTGLGLGGAFPNLIALVAQESQPRYRSVAVSIMASGMPFGGVLAAVVSLVYSGPDLWRLVFYIGGVGPILLAPVILWVLRGSEPDISRAPAPQAGARQAGPAPGYFQALFGEGRATVTLLLWGAYFLTSCIFYILLNWLPSLIMAQGLNAWQAAWIQILFNFGGGVGALLVGATLARRRSGWLVMLVYAGIVVALLLLTEAGNFSLLVAGGFVAGLFSMAANTFLHGSGPLCYPDEVCGTGVGAAIGISRLGATLGPVFIGQLLALGVQSSQTMLVCIPLAIVAALVGVALVRRTALAG
ncbi:3-(3-hydroxy-phenyl)propionate transporter MhpT [Kerstersia gyiorum]|uniref:3-(3-hydroxy-phenyl)propionate transporter MhpT n=1 Tax=Kerstersia gyiorum TaxID=206506 RepID=UPI0020A1DF70|nr:3-(3-hydroxy-phenyl)propionate transporter MhpT [Kerstersia gyiorum]MCP1635571.1 AAHS family 3-hydroxyphenylpropionic acid transporter [Kerstersia gyiorum]MCP1671023.1 AAHS family 3-hydroxyphenylpropionic acid transporter [Kerstersia gyiorum]MCP1678323.1 AAHS family 3-hydroxyphenylpropionic acid transporter [Kerstersia gyiorum]MCP1708635.1 AAHS family 3-hydroxyphenylpropionic acid transporter [Kerstersia gyiorum]MCP1711766.1 AAHS family 3-hydroxyphenylpropionic acid transporter [Kerstersia 